MVVTPVKAKSRKTVVLPAPESLRQVINKRRLEITVPARDSDADLSDDGGIAVGTKRKPPPDDITFAPR